MVPSNQMASGSTNSVLHAGTGPKSRFSISTKLPVSAKSCSCGWDSEIKALDSCNISDLKSKSGGGGLIETLKGLVGLIVGIFGCLEKLGNVDFRRISME